MVSRTEYRGDQVICFMYGYYASFRWKERKSKKEPEKQTGRYEIDQVLPVKVAEARCLMYNKTLDEIPVVENFNASAHIKKEINAFWDIFKQTEAIKEIIASLPIEKRKDVRVLFRRKPKTKVEDTVKEEGPVYANLNEFFTNGDE